MRLSRIAAPLALALACLPCIGQASEDFGPVDRASFQIGFALPQFDTRLRADGETLQGSSVDFDRDLGLDSSNIVGNLGITWRPFYNHEFSLSYLNDDASSTRQISRDIVFDDVVYEANATVKSHQDLDAYSLAYVWWMKHGDTWALGPRVGLVYYRMNIGIDLELDANGDEVVGGASREVSPDVPAPVIGGSWRWVPEDGWRLRVDAGYFSTSLSGIDGAVYYVNAGAEWFPWKNWGLSLNYSIQDIDVDADRDAFSGNLNFVNRTATLGLIYRF